MGAAMSWAEAWVGEHYPPRVETELAAFEQLHHAQFMENYGRAVNQFYVQYDALVAVVDHVNFVAAPSWPAHRTIQFVLLAKNLKAFHSAMDRLSKGFYQDAMGLTRSLYDTFLRVVHVSCFSDAPEGALVDRPLPGVQSPSAAAGLRREFSPARPPGLGGGHCALGLVDAVAHEPCGGSPVQGYKG
jgi:hypothetical protein